jgi:hypothetical protein
MGQELSNDCHFPIGCVHMYLRARPNLMQEELLTPMWPSVSRKSSFFLQVSVFTYTLSVKSSPEKSHQALEMQAMQQRLSIP